MSIVLNMSRSDYEKILAHCREGLPNESCGLLAGTVEGDVKTVTKVYLLTNIDASNEHFSMDPKEQLAAVKDARANQVTIIGNFHSHPESPSRPSSTSQSSTPESSTDSPWRMSVSRLIPSAPAEARRKCV